MVKMTRGLAIYFCGLAAVTLMFALFIVNHKLVVVSGQSMMPTLRNGEILVANKTVIPMPGKIYLVIEPDDEVYAIKRLIGIPGDVVALRDGATYVNDKLVMEATGTSWDNTTFVLEADEYLFLGDNRGVSYDGRYWSRPIKASEILYEVSIRIYPFATFGEVT